MKQENGQRLLQARHVSVSIDRAPAQVYAFAADVANLPRWASGLANFSGSVRFVEANSFGVLDHDVELASGQTVHNAMRVVPNAGGSEVTFTLLRRAEMSEQDFAADAATVQADLVELKRLLEEQPLTPSADGAQHAHHALDYTELTVTDLSAAKAFYAAAFGWRFHPYGPGYAGIQGNGREVGGLRADSECTGALVLLYSRDLDATLRAVRDAGGRIVNGPYAFPGGRRFHFTDPSGNELAVWAHT